MACWIAVSMRVLGMHAARMCACCRARARACEYAYAFACAFALALAPAPAPALPGLLRQRLLRSTARQHATSLSTACALSARDGTQLERCQVWRLTMVLSVWLARTRPTLAMRCLGAIRLMWSSFIQGCWRLGRKSVAAWLRSPLLVVVMVETAPISR